MLLLIIIFASILIVTAFGFSVNLKRRRTILQTETPKEFEPPVYRSLFAPTDEEMAIFEREEREKLLAERSEIVRQNLLARAGDGDFTVLTDAKELDDLHFYEKLLDLLTEKNKLVPEKLIETAIFVSDNQLRANETFVQAVSRQYLENPQTNFLPKVLHVSVLTDSAENYLQTIEAVFNLWKQKKLEKISADGLIALFESHYRLLPSNKKASGAGFLLKEKLGNIRREVLGK
ncbi:MAG: hypothetical protein M3033_17470 [Acidobacteriota bacterium]|nr:hypothetical protein [Acidobacteriota bacterium]